MGRYGKLPTTNGKSRSRAYGSWCRMFSRCHNKEDKDYHRYGGRGISICERWNSFDKFYLDMGERAEDMSIDREDNDGDYTAANCRWATPKEQALNRSNTLYIEYHGINLPIKKWAAIAGISYFALMNRYRKGGDTFRILNTPVKLYHKAAVTGVNFHASEKLWVISIKKQGRHTSIKRKDFFEAVCIRKSYESKRDESFSELMTNYRTVPANAKT